MNVPLAVPRSVLPLRVCSITNSCDLKRCNNLFYIGWKLTAGLVCVRPSCTLNAPMQPPSFNTIPVVVLACTACLNMTGAG